MPTTKRKAYVLVPRAPYRLPGQSSQSRRRSQANSSTSALLVTRDELQPTFNRPERRVPPSQPPIPLPPDVSNALTELTARAIADKVMERVNFMLTNPMGSLDTSSNITEAPTVSSPISVPVSSSTVPSQLGSTPGPPARMSAVSHSPSLPSSPDSIKQAATELGRNPSTQDPSLGLFVNAQNILISGGTFINIHPVDTGKGK